MTDKPDWEKTWEREYPMQVEFAADPRSFAGPVAKAQCAAFKAGYLASAAHLEAAVAKATEEQERRGREGRQLLTRMVKYVREDRAVTPRSTRLARLTDDVADYLQRTFRASDSLRGEPEPTAVAATEKEG